jgi:hypothetical protein
MACGSEPECPAAEQPPVVRPRVEAEPSPRPPPIPDAVPEVVDPKHDIVVDFDPDEPGIYLDVELEGPSGQRKRLAYLFDSGASFLTITTATAGELGIEIPADAPRIEFHTAAGMRSVAMVQLSGLTVGPVRIPNLAVSICDPCATERGAGLLGLNVIREFVVQTDYQASQMRLLPRAYEGRPNRAYDIQPMLEIAIDGPAQIRDGDVEWVVALRNNSPIAVEAVVPRVNFKNAKQLRGAAVARIEPGETGRSVVAGKVLSADEDGSALSYTLSLAEAYW